MISYHCINANNLAMLASERTSNLQIIFFKPFKKKKQFSDFFVSFPQKEK